MLLFWGLIISLNKTETLYQSVPNTKSINHCWWHSAVKCKQLQIHGKCHLEWWDYGQRNWSTRINKDSQVLRQLHTRVLNKCRICFSTKLKVYRAVVTPSFFYKGKSWTHQRYIKQLKKFHMCALHGILSIYWTVSPPWRSTKSTSIESLIISDPRWDGWEIWSQLMTVICLASCSMVNWRLGKRPQGHPCKFYKDAVKETYNLVTSNQQN